MSKVLLVQPPDPPYTQVLRDHMGKFGIIKKSTRIFRDDVLPPLDLAYSASLLEKNGYDVDVIDSPTLKLNSSRVLKQIKRESPELVVVNSTCVSLLHDLDFAANVKDVINGIVAIAGPHITLIPDIALKKKGIDLVIRGEIEFTILELSQKLSDFRNIKGIVYRDDGRIINTPDRPFIKNLDDLPFPAYHLLPMKKYSYHLLKKRPFTTFLSSRGCPFGCIYCPYPIGYGNFWRGRSPENVLSELKMLVDEYGVKSVLFRDQVFTFDMSRAEKICRGIINHDLDLEWRCETRVDRLSKDLMIEMKRAGCVGIHLGVESGDPVILEKIAKTGTNIQQIKEVFKKAREVGLETVAFFMIGLPGETKESISRTLDLAKSLNSDITWFTAAVPYPGTKLYELAERKGWILTKDWERYSGREVVMRTDHLTEEEIRNALERAKKISVSKDGLLRTTFSRRGIASFLSDPKKTMKYVFSRFK